MTGLTLDAGALIAVDKRDRRVAGLIRHALEAERRVTVPAGALAQTWRDGARQVTLTRLLASVGVTIEPLDARLARLSGRLCGASGTRDIVDASVVIGATMRGDAILTSDVDELRRLDPEIELVAV